MTEIPFHATLMGRRYYEATLPRLADEIARLNATIVELIEAIDRNGKPRWTPDTDHGSHVATPMNPKP